MYPNQQLDLPWWSLSQAIKPPYGAFLFLQELTSYMEKKHLDRCLKLCEMLLLCLGGIFGAFPPHPSVTIP